MDTTLSIHLQDFTKSYPTGAVLTDETENVLDSEYCDTLEEFVEFAVRNKKYIDEETNICIVANIEDIDTTNVLQFGNEVATAIKKATREGEEYES